MKYRLLKDIGYIHKDTMVQTETEHITLRIDDLLTFGYIEDISEPWATDKDIAEFVKYHYGSGRFIDESLEQFKKEKGK
jgi:hypothetical protein